MEKVVKRVLLAYSGGLDTSVIVRWLVENYKCEVICFAADIGQEEELTGLESKALSAGASRLIVKDLKDQFVEEFVYPMLRGSARYETDYLLGTAIARPLIAKAQIEIAKEEGCDGVSHGSTGKGNDQVRFELAYQALNPKIKIIAPWREWEIKSREAAIDYAMKWGIDAPVTKEKPWSMDRNLFHISFEGGLLEDPSNPPPEDMFVLTKSPKDAIDKESLITIDYEAGNPVKLNGEKLTPAQLLMKLNQLGSENGIGRADIVENRFVGMKSRGVYETPGGTILHQAHRALESITLDREVMRLRDTLIPEYARMIYNGFWFSPEREALQAFIDKTQENVTGQALIALYKGNVIIRGRSSNNSLYDQRFSTFEDDDVYNQQEAEGFINLNALRLKIAKLAKI
ncbi:MAG: argininosuccinate synthase [Nitrospinota bacterium]